MRTLLSRRSGRETSFSPRHLTHPLRILNLDVIYNEDCISGMRKLPAESVDAIVTDPPYHLTQNSRGGSPRQNDPDTPHGRTRLGSKGFMGKTWDGGDIAHQPELWREVLRVLKPGGHLLSFGGTRTYHRMAVAIEDAGFEIRDQLTWVYGSGFPKSQDVSKQIDKQAGAKRNTIARYQRPDGSAPRDNVIATKYSGRAYNSGIASGDGNDGHLTAPATDAAKQWSGWGSALKPALEPICLARKPLSESTIAANVLKHGTGSLNVDGCRINTNGEKLSFGSRQLGDGIKFGKCVPTTPGIQNVSGRWPANLLLNEEAAQALDEQSGHLVSGNNPALRSADKHRNVYAGWKGQQCLVRRGTDSGGASRFFYVAKASKRERGEGNNHPTVKPLKLIEYLVRLITPPNGIVLDPFMGSGTTALACISEGFHYIGFEQDASYFRIAQKRIAEHNRATRKLAAAAA